MTSVWPRSNEMTCHHQYYYSGHLIVGYIERVNFHTFHKSITISKGFTLKMFTETSLQSALDELQKNPPQNWNN